MNQKNWNIFTYAAEQNSPPVFIITPQVEENYPFPQKCIFWRFIFRQQKEGCVWGGGGREVVKEDYGVEKFTEIKPMKVLVTSFDKFPHLCNLYVFGFYSVVPYISYKCNEVWRLFNLTKKMFTKNHCAQDYLHEIYNLALPYFFTILPTICQIKSLSLRFFPILKSFIPLISKQIHFYGTKYCFSVKAT